MDFYLVVKEQGINKYRYSSDKSFYILNFFFCNKYCRVK